MKLPSSDLDTATDQSIDQALDALYARKRKPKSIIPRPDARRLIVNAVREGRRLGRREVWDDEAKGIGAVNARKLANSSRKSEVALKEFLRVCAAMKRPEQELYLLEAFEASEVVDVDSETFKAIEHWRIELQRIGALAEKFKQLGRAVAKWTTANRDRQNIGAPVRRKQVRLLDEAWEKITGSKAGRSKADTGTPFGKFVGLILGAAARKS